MTAIAPPTDCRQPDGLSDFLEGTQFAVCPMICGSNEYQAKRKRNGLQMKHKYSALSVSRPFFSISSDFPSVACFRCRMPQERMAGRGKVFGLNTLQRRKILPETALPPVLATAIQAMRYLRIRASGTGGWRDELQLYHRLLPLPQETNNVTGVSFLMARISFITNRLNRILSLLHILNATAMTISTL